MNGIGGRGAGDGPGASAESTVPNGAITMPEAMESQLGLRLRMGKRPLPVLVIDSIFGDAKRELAWRIRVRPWALGSGLSRRPGNC